MLKTAPDHAVCRPHAATLPTAPTRHPLELLADRAATRLAGCTATLIAGCYAPAMLMVENCAAGEAHATATWLVTIASPTTMGFTGARRCRPWPGPEPWQCGG